MGRRASLVSKCTLIESNYQINVSVLAVTATDVSKLSNNQTKRARESSGVQQSNISWNYYYMSETHLLFNRAYELM